jgi:hypothetical protein
MRKCVKEKFWKEKGGMQRGKVVPVTKEDSNSRRMGQEGEGARSIR